MLIEEYLSRYDVSEFHQIKIHAPADYVYAAARSLDLSDSPIIRLLFRLRELPAFFKSNARSKGLGLTMDELLKSGFILLADSRREIVLGLVGRFWTWSGCIQHLDAEEFKAFDRKGFAKAAWNFYISEQGGGVSILSTETRVLCLDKSSLRRFRFYWFMIGRFSGLVRRVMLRSIRDEAEKAFRGEGA
jgi:hypothetical protein